MRSDIPRFRGSSDEDEARWEAYREMIRRDAAGEEGESEGERPAPRGRRAFGPLTLEAAERAFADAEPDSLWSTETLRLEMGDEARQRHARGGSRPGRNTRLIVVTLALMVGIILAVALVPHHPREPAVIAWSHGKSAQPTAAAPQPAATPAPTVSAAPLPPVAPASAVTPPAAPAPAQTEPPAMAMSAVVTTADTRSDRVHRVHHVLRGETSERPCADCGPRASAAAIPDPRDGQLSCWLTQMNNGDTPGSPDAGMSACKARPHPPKFHDQD